MEGNLVPAGIHFTYKMSNKLTIVVPSMAAAGSPDILIEGKVTDALLRSRVAVVAAHISLDRQAPPQHSLAE